MGRGRAVGAPAVALALSIGVVSVSDAAAPASARPDSGDRSPAGQDAACIREGLASIPVALRASRGRADEPGTPELVVRWSGKPLVAGCEARRTVAFEVTLWFPHLRFSFTEGFPSPWLEFWNGRKAVRNGKERYVSNASFRGLGCLRKARGKLRYEVVTPGGAILGKRISSAPVKIPACSE